MEDSSKSWRNIFYAVDFIIIAISFLWLLVEPGFEPILGLITSIAGLIGLLAQSKGEDIQAFTNWMRNKPLRTAGLLITILFTFLFLRGLILESSTSSIEQASSNSNDSNVNIDASPSLLPNPTPTKTATPTPTPIITSGLITYVNRTDSSTTLYIIGSNGQSFSLLESEFGLEIADIAPAKDKIAVISTLSGSGDPGRLLNVVGVDGKLLYQQSFITSEEIKAEFLDDQIIIISNRQAEKITYATINLMNQQYDEIYLSENSAWNN